MSIEPKKDFGISIVKAARNAQTSYEFYSYQSGPWVWAITDACKEHLMSKLRSKDSRYKSGIISPELPFAICKNMFGIIIGGTFFEVPTISEVVSMFSALGYNQWAQSAYYFRINALTETFLKSKIDREFGGEVRTEDLLASDKVKSQAFGIWKKYSSKGKVVWPIGFWLEFDKGSLEEMLRNSYRVLCYLQAIYSRAKKDKNHIKRASELYFSGHRSIWVYVSSTFLGIQPGQNVPEQIREIATRLASRLSLDIDLGVYQGKTKLLRGPGSKHHAGTYCIGIDPYEIFKRSGEWNKLADEIIQRSSCGLTKSTLFKKTNCKSLFAVGCLHQQHLEHLYDDKCFSEQLDNKTLASIKRTLETGWWPSIDKTPTMGSDTLTKWVNSCSPKPKPIFQTERVKHRGTLHKSKQKPVPTEIGNCITKIMNTDIPENTGRNQALLALGLALWPSLKQNTEKVIWQKNKSLSSPLPDSEIKCLVKKISSGKLFFSCNAEGIAKFCDKNACPRQQQITKQRTKIPEDVSGNLSKSERRVLQIMLYSSFELGHSQLCNLNRQSLIEKTGYKWQTIRKAIRKLENKRLVRHQQRTDSRQCWVIII